MKSLHKNFVPGAETLKQADNKRGYRPKKLSRHRREKIKSLATGIIHHTVATPLLCNEERKRKTTDITKLHPCDDSVILYTRRAN